MYTKLQAIKELQKLDHAFLSPEGVKKIGEPFGVYETYKLKNEPKKFKGLNCPEYKDGEMVEGLDAHCLAILICEKEDVEYLSMFGIGSQLSVCCEAMIKHLTKK